MLVEHFRRSSLTSLLFYMNFVTSDKVVSICFFHRREDKMPSKSSRVCSCHFRGGKKSNGPEIFERNRKKLFHEQRGSPPKKKKIETDFREKTLTEMIEDARKNESPSIKENIEQKQKTTREVILEAELDLVKRDLKSLEEQVQYKTRCYTVGELSGDVVRMETGLPTKRVFEIVVRYALRFKDSINYFAGWTVESISFEDQIFITLMKVKQNYTNLHLAQLFNCSVATIANIISTFIHVLHAILFNDIMTSIPSRDKNKLSAPSSFNQYSSCRIVIDCTDIEVAAPGLMSQQNATYSSYRGMNSFKVLVGVAPNAVITYVSKLYPGSISDKAIVQESGLLNHLTPGDMILADKGFLIQDIVPRGVSVNIPPFLNNGTFTESEAKATKAIATCQIHVERTNARLKDFRILSFIPSYLLCYANVLFQLVAALVNLQFPLIKEGCEDMVFE